MSPQWISLKLNLIDNEFFIIFPGKCDFRPKIVLEIKLMWFKESQSSSQRFFTSSPVKFIRIYLKSLFSHKVLLIHGNLIALFRKPKFVNLNHQEYLSVIQ